MLKSLVEIFIAAVLVTLSSHCIEVFASGDERPKCSALLLKDFKPDSAFVVSPGIEISPDVIAKTIEFFRQHEVDQLNFGAVRWGFGDPAKVDLRNFPYQSAYSTDGRLKSELALDTSIETLFLLIPRGSRSNNVTLPNSYLSREEANELPPELVQALTQFLNKVARDFIESFRDKGDFIVNNAHIVLRITSNTVGQTVTGLHAHSPMVAGRSDRIEFAWALKGLGTIAQVGDELVHTQEAEALIFGNRAPHGSPDSEGLRLLALGGVSVRRRTGH